MYVERTIKNELPQTEIYVNNILLCRAPVRLPFRYVTTFQLMLVGPKPAVIVNVYNTRS